LFYLLVDIDRVVTSQFANLEKNAHKAGLSSFVFGFHDNHCLRISKVSLIIGMLHAIFAAVTNTNKNRIFPLNK